MDNGMNQPATNLPIKIEIDEETMLNNAANKSEWRDIDIFLPVDDIAQIEQIQTLFRVSKLSSSRNYIKFECRQKVGEGKCKYFIRWRKMDGMVQSKGKHGHKTFTELHFRKCRECNFECFNRAIMRNHYLQNHNDKSFWHCPKCAATFKNANELHWHIRGMHSNSNKHSGDLAELKRRLDAIIEEWEAHQRMNNQPMAFTSSNLTIVGGLFNDQRQQYAVQNNNLFHQQPSSIPSTNNEMPATPAYFLDTTNLPRKNEKLQQR